jgi:hypothetical protein
MTSLGNERSPGTAAGLHDGLVVGQQPVREGALAQVQLDALDRFQVGTVCRQRHEGEQSCSYSPDS